MAQEADGGRTGCNLKQKIMVIKHEVEDKVMIYELKILKTMHKIQQSSHV